MLCNLKAVANMFKAYSAELILNDMKCTLDPSCDTYPTERLKTIRDRWKKGKCCRKEGLIEDDKERDTESQLEKRRGSGPTEGGFRENSETEKRGMRREEEKKRRNKGGYD